MWRNCDKFITLESYELGTDRARGTTTIYIYSIFFNGNFQRDLTRALARATFETR